MMIYVLWGSEAFSVNNGCSSFLIFCFSNPHGLESGEGTEDGASDPDQKFTFSRSYYLDFHGWRSKSSHFLAETFWNTRVHSCTTAHYDVAIKVLADVDIALQNGVVGDFVEAGHFLADHHGLEKSFRAAETLRTDSDDLSIRQFVVLVILVWAIVSYISQNLPAISAS